MDKSFNGLFNPNIREVVESPRNPQIINTSFDGLFDPNTTVVIEPPRNKRIPVRDAETIILYGLTKRTAGYSGFELNKLDAAVIKVILETNQDLYKLKTYEQTPFQSVLLLKEENIFDTKNLILTCINNFITPHMIANYTIKQLIHYAYTLSNNPCLINKICKPCSVDLNHDYYKDLSDYQQKEWYTYNLV